jgi:3-methyladenine DNA glycosylase AlkC
MPEPLKESLFNMNTINQFADCICSAEPGFDRDAFLKQVFDQSWDGLELKERMHHVTLCLRDFLPPDYRSALAILQRAAEFFKQGSFSALVFCDFVEINGLDDWEASLPALEQFTCLCSAEFAVRPFLTKDYPKMMAKMQIWAESENPHHRRLASEGSRPRLPWGIAVPGLKSNPTPILTILETLKRDKTDMVRRSVANNLNDISKDHPKLVIRVLKAWKAEGIPAYEEIANRALRTLVKNGDPEALALVGFTHGGEFEIKDLTLNPQTPHIGGEVQISFTLQSTSQQEQKLVVDYVVYLLRANGTHTPKVFKLTKKVLSAGQIVKILKKHSFREVTTRRYYPGAHSIEIQVNGIPCACGNFLLEKSIGNEELRDSNELAKG